MSKKKTVTIEDLAGMVQRGFKDVDKRFDGVEDRLDSIAPTTGAAVPVCSWTR
jgi:hypothetical protein